MSTNKAIYVEDTFSYGNYVCKVSKLQHMYVIGLILLSVLETTKKKQQAILNLKFWIKLTLIWVVFLRVRFYHLAPTRLLVWKTIPSFEFRYISCILYVRLFWPISVSTKNLSRKKTVYIKVFLNQCTFILIIYYL